MKIEVLEDKRMLIDGEASAGRHLTVRKRHSGTEIYLDDEQIIEPVEVWMYGRLFATNRDTDDA